MKLIKWDEISDQDLNLISLIVERAKTPPSTAMPLAHATKAGLKQDVAAYHLASPLRLDDLLKAPIHDLLHDVHGIYVSLNRATGEPRGCFTPRFAFKLTEEQEAEKLGYYLINLFDFQVKDDGQVKTGCVEKTPLGLGRFVRRIVKEKLYLED